MQINYTAEVITWDNRRLDVLTEIVRLEATRSFNNNGILTLTLPDIYDFDFFRWNSQIVLWRTVGTVNTHKFGDTHWFVRKIARRQAQRSIVVEAVDAFGVLADRLVAYTAETPYADKTLEEFMLVLPDDRLRLDNMMRAYMRENYGSLALDPRRNTPQIIIGPDENLAPYGEKKASWTDLASVLRDLAAQSEAQGMKLYYDLVPTDDSRFEFRIWTGVRNTDRGIGSPRPVILSDTDGSLENAEEVLDYSDVGAACYALGYDRGSALVYSLRTNEQLIAENPFSRVEFTISESEADNLEYLERKADGALQGKKPKRTVTAQVVDGTTARYGIDFFYGDRVIAGVFGRQYDCMIDAVRVSWEDGKERLDIRLSGEDFIE